MIFVTGPLFSGKKTALKKLLNISDEDFSKIAVWDVQERADEDLNALLEELVNYDIVISTEIGGGVVPMDKAEREHRECAGRLACALAEKADVVIRVCCGIPQIIKGELK